MHRVFHRSCRIVSRRHPIFGVLPSVPAGVLRKRILHRRLRARCVTRPILIHHRTIRDPLRVTPYPFNRTGHHVLRMPAAHRRPVGTARANVCTPCRAHRRANTCTIPYQYMRRRMRMMLCPLARSPMFFIVHLLRPRPILLA